ncbi:hypothetical protein [Chryseobacterium sp. G0201]|uniref:hypothetical protein n=1 Tax=Chryseobacterium sp. G0201 TaxID=2487065 RepID=UPI000F4F9EC5|nr:hypothetical protein [Chryseobacterium sp. G0201]AZA54578.1 hypothetical protein EG348_17045 [Chryseobacterium sp. G0201]
MKTKIMLLIFLAFAVSKTVVAQKVSLNSRVNMVLPSKTQKITTADLTAIAKQNDIQVVSLPNSENRSVYLTDNVLVTVFASKKPEKVDLDKVKKGLDEMAKGLSSYSSKIVSIKGNKFLITENTTENKLRFFGTNSSGTSSVNGLLEFNGSGREKAKAVLDSVIPNISFEQ